MGDLRSRGEDPRSDCSIEECWNFDQGCLDVVVEEVVFEMFGIEKAEVCSIEGLAAAFVG